MFEILLQNYFDERSKYYDSLDTEDEIIEEKSYNKSEEYDEF